MKKRSFVRIISFLCALIIIAGVAAIKLYNSSNKYKNELMYTYAKSFDDFATGISNIDVALQKAVYVNTAAGMLDVSSEIFTESKMAKQAFSQFPIGEETKDAVNKFLSQAGNYTVYLAQKMVEGIQIDYSEKENLEKLSNVAKSVAAGTDSIRAEYNNMGYWSSTLNSGLQKNVENSVGDSFSDIEEAITDYPTLLYDGPFSDNLTTDNSELLANAKVVDETFALDIAAKAISVNKEKLHFEGSSEGKIPAYIFTAENTTAEVSKQGGYLIFFRKYYGEGDSVLAPEIAVSKAEKYLYNMFKDKFVKTYYYIDNGVCVVNFAFKDGKTVCYTDLIKIGVDMSNGEIVLYEARAYLSNHKNRAIGTPENSVDKAQKILSNNLTVVACTQCIIPSSGGYEKHCYEFYCVGKNNIELLVYIDCNTLNEEQIFILLKSDGGTLTK